MVDSAPAPDNMRLERLATVLRVLLPPQYMGRAEEIALLVIALARPGEGPALARRRLADDPALGAALASLQGQTIPGGAALVSFAGAQTGDVTIGDIAGGDMLKLSLVLPPAPERAPPFLVPHDPNPLFLGRERELAHLKDVLLGDARAGGSLVAALVGAGGMGKTQLAVAIAYRHRDAFPGGVLWLRMEQPESIPARVVELGGPGGLDLPGWAGLSFEDRVAAVRRVWGEPMRRLLIFDNLEDPALLRDWRPRGGGARVLITTRRGVWPTAMGVRPLILQSLGRQDSMTLLLAPRAASQGYDAADLLADPAVRMAADAVAETVGDLPLALAIAGAYLESSPGTTPAHYLARLRAAPLQELILDDDLAEGLPTGHLADVAATIRLSYDRLDEVTPVDAHARLLLERASHLAPAPLPPALLVRLLDRSPDDPESPGLVDRVTRRLVSLGLGERAGAGPLSIHRLILAFARSTSGSEDADFETTVTALIAAAGDLPASAPGADGLALATHLRHVAPNIMTRADRTAEQLASVLGRLLYALDDLVSARAWHEQAVALAERLAGPAHPRTARRLAELSPLLRDFGDLPEARDVLARALSISEGLEEPDHMRTVRIMHDLGLVLRRLGDLAGARTYLERARSLAAHYGGPNHPETARSLVTLANVLRLLGQPAQARDLIERALVIYELAYGPDTAHAARARHSLGVLLEGMGDLAGARAQLERALASYEALYGPTHSITAPTLSVLGQVLHASGDLVGARTYLERAATADERTYGPNHPEVVPVLVRLGQVQYDLGDAAAASAYALRAITILEHADGVAADPFSRRNTLAILGRLLRDLGDQIQARAYLTRALAVATRALGAEHPDTVALQTQLAALDPPPTLPPDTSTGPT